MSEEIQYQVEDAPVGGFWQQRWVRVSSVAVVGVIALGGAFAAGILAGEHLQKTTDDSAMSNRMQQFGNGFGNGQNGNGFGNGQARQFGGGFPGGQCPATDADHCAGTDRNFQVPNNVNPSALPTPATGTTNP